MRAAPKQVDPRPQWFGGSSKAWDECSGRCLVATRSPKCAFAYAAGSMRVNTGRLIRSEEPARVAAIMPSSVGDFGDYGHRRGDAPGEAFSSS